MERYCNSLMKVGIDMMKDGFRKIAAELGFGPRLQRLVFDSDKLSENDLNVFLGIINNLIGEYENKYQISQSDREVIADSTLIALCESREISQDGQTKLTDAISEDSVARDNEKETSQKQSGTALKLSSEHNGNVPRTEGNPDFNYKKGNIE